MEPSACPPDSGPDIPDEEIRHDHPRQRPHRAGPDENVPGRFIPVVGEWSAPTELADAVASEVHREITTAIIWVHDPYRNEVTEQLDDVLAPGATVLHVWGSASRDPREFVEEQPATGDHLARHVVLGYLRSGGVSRWLTDEEISGGVLRALDNGVVVSVVGTVDPWGQRP